MNKNLRNSILTTLSILTLAQSAFANPPNWNEALAARAHQAAQTYYSDTQDVPSHDAFLAILNEIDRIVTQEPQAGAPIAHEAIASYLLSVLERAITHPSELTPSPLTVLTKSILENTLYAAEEDAPAARTAIVQNITRILQGSLHHLNHPVTSSLAYTLARNVTPFDASALRLIQQLVGSDENSQTRAALRALIAEDRFIDDLEKRAANDPRNLRPGRPAPAPLRLTSISRELLRLATGQNAFNDWMANGLVDTGEAYSDYAKRLPLINALNELIVIRTTGIQVEAMDLIANILRAHTQSATEGRRFLTAGHVRGIRAMRVDLNDARILSRHREISRLLSGMEGELPLYDDITPRARNMARYLERVTSGERSEAMHDAAFANALYDLIPRLPARSQGQAWSDVLGFLETIAQRSPERLRENGNLNSLVEKLFTRLLRSDAPGALSERLAVIMTYADMKQHCELAMSSLPEE